MCRRVNRHSNWFMPLGCYHHQDLNSELCELEGKILDAYIEQKAEPLIGFLEPGMTVGDFKWHSCLPPTGQS